MKNFIKKLYFHPFLFILYPVFSIFADNVAIVPLHLVLLYSFILLVFVSFVYIFLYKEEKNVLIISLIILFFFYYGFFSLILSHLKIGEFVFKRNLYIAPVYFIIFGMTGYILLKIKDKKIITSINKIVNFCAIGLLFIPIIKVCSYYSKIFINGPNSHLVKEANIINSSKSALTYPDVYYIILDGYARHDTLKEIFNYDNSEFITYLEKNGFYVPQKSCSNYAMTSLSIPSSLSMNYIEKGKSPKNEVLEILSKNGYKYINLSSYYFYQYKDKNNVLSRQLFANEFFTVLLNVSIARILSARFHFFYADSVRKNILYSIETLKESATIESPKFVFAHILCPHPPYVFGANGEKVDAINPIISFNIFKTSWDDKRAYVNQVKFINNKVREIVSTILKNSKNPPVIILQADHGPPLDIEYDKKIKVVGRIFMACYFPNTGKEFLYDMITPVNIFRLMFNCYFKYKFCLLEDKFFYSDFSAPYKFVEIPISILN